jgi:hypothetical protein
MRRGKRRKGKIYRGYVVVIEACIACYTAEARELRNVEDVCDERKKGKKCKPGCLDYERLLDHDIPSTGSQPRKRVLSLSLSLSLSREATRCRHARWYSTPMSTDGVLPL